MAQEELKEENIRGKEKASPYVDQKLKEELVNTLNAPHPAKLRRGITINPDDLTESFFTKPITTTSESVINNQ